MEQSIGILNTAKAQQEPREQTAAHEASQFYNEEHSTQLRLSTRWRFFATHSSFTTFRDVVNETCQDMKLFTVEPANFFIEQRINKLHEGKTARESSL